MPANELSSTAIHCGEIKENLQATNKPLFVLYSSLYELFIAVEHVSCD